MARTKLVALLSPREEDKPVDGAPAVEPAPESLPEPAPEQQPEPTPAAQPAPSARTRPAAAPRPRPASTTPKPRPSAPAPALPPYLRFERKEARLRDDQLVALNTRARQLNKTKDPDADRITDNTLIRVAVDLLISRADELSGGDEEGLRQSLGLA